MVKIAGLDGIGKLYTIAKLYIILLFTGSRIE
jgi:hypothetical protein